MIFLRFNAGKNKGRILIVLAMYVYHFRRITHEPALLPPAAAVGRLIPRSTRYHGTPLHLVAPQTNSVTSENKSAGPRPSGSVPGVCRPARAPLPAGRPRLPRWSPRRTFSRPGGGGSGQGGASDRRRLVVTLPVSRCEVRLCVDGVE